MSKKHLLAVGLICGMVAGSASASDILPQFYAGAGVGVVNNTSSSAANTSAPGYFRGFPFTIFVGYGGLIDQDFYLGGELFGTLGTAEITSENGLKSSYGFGASVIPGTFLSQNTMIFGRLGLVKTQFSTVDESTSGFQVGAGIQSALMPSIDLRFEYDFTAYNSVGGINSPRQDAVTLSFVYKMD